MSLGDGAGLLPDHLDDLDLTPATADARQTQAARHLLQFIRQATGGFEGGDDLVGPRQCHHACRDVHRVAEEVVRLDQQRSVLQPDLDGNVEVEQ